MSRLPFKVDRKDDNYILINYGYEVCSTSPEGKVEYLYTDTPDKLIKEMSKKNKYKTIPYIRTSNREVKKRLDYINNLAIKNMEDLVNYLSEICKYIEEGYIAVNTESEILKGLFIESEDQFLESLSELAIKFLKTIRKSNISKGIVYKNIPVDTSNESAANISSILESFSKLGGIEKVEFKGENGKHIILNTEQDAKDLYAAVYIHRSSSFGAEYEVVNRVRNNEHTIVTELTTALKEGNDKVSECLDKYFQESYERRRKDMLDKYLKRY